MNDDILWWSTGQWQAVGTIVLVLVTIAYAVITGILSSHANRSATSAEKSTRAAERGLLLQMMPLVFGRRVQKTGSGRTDVTLYATGDTPAFNLKIVVRQDGREGHSQPLSSYDPAEGPRQIDLSSGFALVNYPHPYEVEVTYYDALGNGYRTRWTSLLGGESATHVDRWDEGTKEWVPLV